MPKTTPAPEASPGFAAFLYNKERGEVLGRTSSSWAKIGLFYVIYYTGLACFFIALLSIFLYSFTDNKAPVLTGAYSVLPPVPGMGYQPMVKAEETLLTYSLAKTKEGVKSRKPYKEGLQNFLETGAKPDRIAPAIKATNYLNPNASLFRTIDECKKGGAIKRDTKPCIFDASTIPDFLTHCPLDDFGYDEGKPCVAIKMNRIYEFVPQISGDGEDIVIKCEGEHLADKDNVGEIKYFPSSTDGATGVIPKYYFPFLGQPNYMTPLVFIKFQDILKNVLVQVVCRPINLDNVKTDGKEDQGKVHFEVYITS